MNNHDEELARFKEHLPRTALMGVLFVSVHTRMRANEQDPSKPFSRAFAYASAGYIFFQLVHAFVRAKRPGFFLYDIFSILCGFAAVIIAISAISSSN